VETLCDEVGLSVNPAKLGLLHSKREGNFLVSLNHTFLALFTSLCVGQASRGSPGFSADVEGARGC
jgi:hypothetical protein